MPKATESIPEYRDEKCDMTYNGHKNSQVLIWNTFRCTTPATEFAVNDEGALCPASQTAVHLYVSGAGLKVGDEIVSYRVNGYVTSGGNTVTVDADFMKVPAAGTPADPTGDNSNDITQVSKTAAYTLVETCTFTSPYTVVTTEAYNVDVLVTTAAGCTCQITSIEVTVNRK